MCSKNENGKEAGDKMGYKREVCLLLFQKQKNSSSTHEKKLYCVFKKEIYGCFFGSGIGLRPLIWYSSNPEIGFLITRRERPPG
jgi:hypothetical protein